MGETQKKAVSGSEESSSGDQVVGKHLPGVCPSLSSHISPWKEEPALVPNLPTLLLLPAAGICVPEIMAQAVLHHLSLLAVVTPISPGVIPTGQPQGPSCQQQWGCPSGLLQTIWVQKPQPCSSHMWFQGLTCFKGAGWVRKPSYLCPLRTSRTSPCPSTQHPECRTGWQGRCGGGVPVSPQGSHASVGLAQGALAPHLSAGSQMQMLGRGTWLSNFSFSSSALPMPCHPGHYPGKDFL